MPVNDDQSETGGPQPYSEVTPEDWMDIEESEFVDYAEGRISFALVFEHDEIGLHGIKFDKATGSLKPVSFETND